METDTMGAMTTEADEMEPAIDSEMGEENEPTTPAPLACEVGQVACAGCPMLQFCPKVNTTDESEAKDSQVEKSDNAGVPSVAEQLADDSVNIVRPSRAEPGVPPPEATEAPRGVGLKPVEQSIQIELDYKAERQPQTKPQVVDTPPMQSTAKVIGSVSQPPSVVREAESDFGPDDAQVSIVHKQPAADSRVVVAPERTEKVVGDGDAEWPLRETVSQAAHDINATPDFDNAELRVSELKIVNTHLDTPPAPRDTRVLHSTLPTEVTAQLAPEMPAQERSDREAFREPVSPEKYTDVSLIDEVDVMSDFVPSEELADEVNSTAPDEERVDEGKDSEAIADLSDTSPAPRVDSCEVSLDLTSEEYKELVVDFELPASDAIRDFQDDVDQNQRIEPADATTELAGNGMPVNSHDEAADMPDNVSELPLIDYGEPDRLAPRVMYEGQLQPGGGYRRMAAPGDSTSNEAPLIDDLPPRAWEDFDHQTPPVVTAQAFGWSPSAWWLGMFAFAACRMTRRRIHV